MEFEVKAGINAFKGKCKEGAVIKIGKSGGVEKLAATGFISLSKNGKPYLSLDKPADVFYEAQNGKPKLTIIDETKTSKVVYPLQ
jgi:hypothetical protein